MYGVEGWARPRFVTFFFGGEDFWVGAGNSPAALALRRLSFWLNYPRPLSSIVAVTPWKDLLERVPGGMNEWYVSTTMHMHSRVVKVSY